ncbi:MAG: hypothetical protein HUJ58_02615 [Erysipelotrichaceae bacterium]|nr:hypothetical protein [Erysipelotrichaceae bacterium]
MTKTPFGTPSIIVILVSLTLATFGVLTVLSAKNDLSNSTMAVEATVEKYDVMGKSEEQLSKLNEDVQKGTVQPGTYTIDIPMSEDRVYRTVVCVRDTLQVVVESAKVVSLDEWETDDFMNLWNGK